MKIGVREIVEKPWGREMWLGLTDKFCFKRIEIKQGYKTSLQLHEFKSETIYLAEGSARFFRNGTQYDFVQEGFTVTIMPGDVHRFEALTDIVLYEASTPEIWDVVRLEDSYGREDK